MEHELTEIAAKLATLNGQVEAIWDTFWYMIGGSILYGIFAVIWYIRLEGKVRTNEKVFEMFMKNSEKKDEEVDKAIQNLYDLTRRVENVANRLLGRSNSTFSGPEN